MKIGIDLRRVSREGMDRASRWLRGTLAALVARNSTHRLVLFHTIHNYHLFPDAPGNVTRRTFSVQRYFEEMQDQLQYEVDYDVVVRPDPRELLDRFPLRQQIACFSYWPMIPNDQDANKDKLRRTRRLLHAFQTGVGAIAVPDEEVRSTIAHDGWTTIADLFVMAEPPSNQPDASWEEAADSLLNACERVAAFASKPTPRLRVTTPPLVSIVTPSFNQGSFIRQTIDSVLQQRYPHIDYWVIDGGSTDETVSILKSYGDRVRWISEKDRGQTHAINKGMERARGEILAYLNSDDLLQPGAVARVVEHFQSRPACDLVYGRDAMIDRDGRYLKMYPTDAYSFERLLTECCISQPAAFWTKRLADLIGPFDESLFLVMDYEYWMRADRAGGVLEHIPDVLAHTRVHPDAKSSGSGHAEAYARKFFRELFDISFRHAGYISSHYVHLWLFTTLYHRNAFARKHFDLVVHVMQQWYVSRFQFGMSKWSTMRAIFHDHRSQVAGRLFREVRGLLQILNPRRWNRPRPPAPLKLEPDLWIGPELEVPYSGGPLRLTGLPARDSVLRIKFAEQELAAVELKADQKADVALEIPASGVVKLSFSDSEVLPDGRRVSFKLLGTTLIPEREAA